MSLFFSYRESRKYSKMGMEPMPAMIAGCAAAIPYTQNDCDVLVGFTMLGISLTRIKVVPKRVMFLPWDTPRYLGGLQSRSLSLLLRTIQRLLFSMKLLQILEIHVV